MLLFAHQTRNGFSTSVYNQSVTPGSYCFTEDSHQTLRAVMSSALFCIQNIPGSNLGSYSRYPNWYLMCLQANNGTVS